MYQRLVFRGDTHGSLADMKQFVKRYSITDKDIVIITGDFGYIWGEDSQQAINELEKYPCLFMFCDGNHENYDMLEAFPETSLFGGRVHLVGDNIYHMIRGEIFDIQGTTILAMGGAHSHDIQDGILNPQAFASKESFLETYGRWQRWGRMFRVKGISWWDREDVSKEDWNNAWKNISTVPISEDGYRHIDYFISHCAPSSVAYTLSMGAFLPDNITDGLEKIMKAVVFKRGFCGHYHWDNKPVSWINGVPFMCLYMKPEIIAL